MECALPNAAPQQLPIDAAREDAVSRHLQRRAAMERLDLEVQTAGLAAAAFQLANVVRRRPGGRRSADQLVDCATSIGANYRASARARSRDEFIAKLGIVNEEADAAVYWLEFIRNVQLAETATVDGLLQEAKELRAIATSALRSRDRNVPRSPDRSKDHEIQD